MVLRVEDTGIGISPDFLPYVFDRFSQADGTATRRHGGLGLGMAIVRYLVELHGGTVAAESPGERPGATFTITLPTASRWRPVTSSRPRRRETADGARRHEELPHLDGVSVLVVDDDADSRSFVCQLLENQGASVAMADSTSEALSRFRQLRPDVLVSDIGMPDEDGYALIRRVRSLASHEGGNMPAIALTAYARSQDETAALSAGYQRHMRKPVDVAELITAVAELATNTPTTAD